MVAGKLYVVATPIGNIKDITLHAIEVLGFVDLILSEDTRETDKILKEYNITTSQISYTDQKHDRVISRIVADLESGLNLALVTDNGTPVISDPGFKLVQELCKRNIEIVAVPGPSTLAAALSVSGLPTDKVSFLGFLPKTASKRKTLIEQYGELESTLTIYESPYRVRRLLIEMYAILGDRAIFIAKDLTKPHEQLIRTTLAAIQQNPEQIKEKGEYTILVAKKDFSNG